MSFLVWFKTCQLGKRDTEDDFTMQFSLLCHYSVLHSQRNLMVGLSSYIFYLITIPLYLHFLLPRVTSTHRRTFLVPASSFLKKYYLFLFFRSVPAYSKTVQSPSSPKFSQTIFLGQKWVGFRKSPCGHYSHNTAAVL